MINFKLLARLFSTLAGIFFTTLVFAANSTPPVGYWKTIDDVTGQPKSILKIWETPEHTLQGRIMKIYPDPGKDEHELCTACKGDNHNKPIVGLMIMWNFKFDGEQWENGRILDARTGKIYHCNMKLINNGQNLHVHGYVGIPLFGRTQTWNRVAGI